MKKIKWTRIDTVDDAPTVEAKCPYCGEVNWHYEFKEEEISPLEDWFCPHFVDFDGLCFVFSDEE